MPKLTIELVPASCWFSNVRDHVTREQWDTIRHKVYRDARYCCQVCGGRGEEWPVECHESWQYDDKTHVQKLVGMVALCPLCHKVKHIGLAGIRGEGELAEAHLARVNDWKSEVARSYVRSAFSIWERRSRCDWKLDMSWLQSNFGIEVESKRG